MIETHRAKPIAECPELDEFDGDETRCTYFQWESHCTDDGPNVCDETAVVCVQELFTTVPTGDQRFEPVDHLCANHFRIEYGTE